MCSGMRLRRGIISTQVQQCIVLPKIHWSWWTEACIINGLWFLGQKCCELQSESCYFYPGLFPREPAYTRAIIGPDNGLFLSCSLFLISASLRPFLLQKLLSDVELQIGLEDAQAPRFWVNVTAFCPNGSTVSGSTKCSSVQPKQTVRKPLM